jgi:hypothetical protein
MKRIFLKIIIKLIEITCNFYPLGNIRKDSHKISMLHPAALAIIYYFTKYTYGYVLEIGSYIGGSTSIAAYARKDRKSKFISIEKGGKHNHPEIPSQNIFEDLKTNLIKLNLINGVKLLNGSSDDKNIIRDVNLLVGDEKISLLIIDADGNVERDMNNFKHLLQDDCIIILDDFSGPEVIKTLPTKIWVEKAIKENLIKQLAVVKWGTFIGVYNNKLK